MSVTRGMPPGERVVERFKPHPLFILLRSWGRLVGYPVAALGAAVALRWLDAGGWADPGWAPAVSAWVWRGALLAVGGQLVWNVLVWWALGYVLTEARVLTVGGVLDRFADETRLSRVQTVTLLKPLEERIFGLGSVGLASAGSGGYEVVWRTVSSPERRIQRVRGLLEGAPEADGLSATPEEAP